MLTATPAAEHPRTPVDATAILQLPASDNGSNSGSDSGLSARRVPVGLQQWSLHDYSVWRLSSGGRRIRVQRQPGFSLICWADREPGADTTPQLITGESGSAVVMSALILAIPDAQLAAANEQPANLTALYHLANAVCASGDLLNADTVDLYCDLIAQLLLRSASEPHRSLQPSDDSKHPSIERLQRLIEHRVTEDIDMQVLANSLHVSVKTLYNLCHRELGMTPSAFVRQIKLQAVEQEMRANPDTSITRVATMYGFTNLSRFAGYFRDTYGTPPSDYLRRLRLDQN